MSYRNLQTKVPRQHGSHSDNCGCMNGYHIWDLEYDDKSERWCICCEHFYSFDDEVEYAAVENAIIMNETIGNKKSIIEPEIKPAGLRKGKIVRRSS